MPHECKQEGIKAFNSIIHSSTLVEATKHTINTYTSPCTDYNEIQEYRPGFYVIIAFILATFGLNILGIVVQHSTFGDLKEKKKIGEIQMMTREGKNQY
jgi:hypothetical protein